MNERPELTKELAISVFKSFYYLKEELVAFCRSEHLSTVGGKQELTERIAHYLDTGEKKAGKRETREKKPFITTLTKASLIEEHFVSSQVHRDFFEEAIGKSFSFNVPFQKWLKAHAGSTYEEAIAAYYRLLEEKKKGPTTIDKQFEYNTYIRDFFTNNGDKSLNEAIKCWKYKKSLQGHNKYEQEDLVALTLE